MDKPPGEGGTRRPVQENYTSNDTRLQMPQAGIEPTSEPSRLCWFPSALDYTFAIANPALGGSHLVSTPSTQTSYNDLQMAWLGIALERVINKCLTCGAETSNPKYCSRRCSAVLNNQHMPKRKRKRFFCQICGSETAYRRKFCEAHQPHLILTKRTTLGEIRRRAKYQANARIRQMARRAYKAAYGLPWCCQVCGYTLHVEVWHRHSIAEFPDNALVSDVNSCDNLVCLCPNHHWEFDHGYLSL